FADKRRVRRSGARSGLLSGGEDGLWLLRRSLHMRLAGVRRAVVVGVPRRSHLGAVRLLLVKGGRGLGDGRASAAVVVVETALTVLL
ncbi:hypothetical protein, partial [Enterobacter hormaechei]|uniref:hypothetical protein n=1 Tax=Enterobacter hormaechei TaxID=158836 RepID=UPI0022F08641